MNVGPIAHDYATLTDNNSIDGAEIQAERQNKEARIQHRLEINETKEIEDAAGSLLYGAGIDDFV